MIATLSGKITDIRESSFVVNVSGVGYEVSAPTGDVALAKIGETLDLIIHEHIREDTYDLYGFTDRKSKELFELLLSVNGVGPKVALAIISNIEGLANVIQSGNTAALQGVSGVGKRVAERIVVDLRNKLGSSGESILELEANSPVYEALTQLGYQSAQARLAVAKIPPDLRSDEARIKWALKELGK